MNLKTFCCLVGVLWTLTSVTQAQGSLVLIPFGATWRYLDNGSDQGTNWTSRTFNDASWASGPGQLGFGEGDEATVLTRGPVGGGSYLTFYFRHSFNLADPSVVSGLLANYQRDDGIVVYVNGVEAFRDNMPLGPVNYLSTAQGNAGDDGQLVLTSVVSPALLVAGNNVVAAEIHQNRSDSSDISFHLELVADASAGPPVILTQPVPATVVEGGTATFSVVAAGLSPFTYQWEFNDDPLPNGTNATLVIPSVTLDNAGFYLVRVTNPEGDVFSDLVELVVSDLGSGIFDDFDPDIDLAQWFSFGSLVQATNHGGSISGPNSLWFGGTGERTATARPLDTSAGGQISFWLHIAGPTSGAPWDNAELPGEGIVLESSVNDGASWQILQTYDQEIYEEWTFIELQVPAIAQGPSTRIRWRQLSFTAANFDHWALDDVRIAVGPAPPSITRQPTSQTAAVGGSALFSVVASGTHPLSYQWDLNGLNIPNATNATLIVSGVTLDDRGTYRVRIVNSLGGVTSDKVTLTVLDLVGDNFRVADLRTTGAVVVEHEPVTGQDLGGIGLSATHVYFTGAGPDFTGLTGRFSAEDLRGGAPLSRAYHGLVSDLKTEILYTLGVGSNPIGNSGGTVTTLLQINATTGELTGTRIDLSTAIPMVSSPGNNGIFSGYGRIALHNGERVYSVSISDGMVIDEGVMPILEHNFCNTWAYWGVAEYFNGTLHLVYIRNPSTIGRVRIPDGAYSTVATFPGSLGNMCGFTVSVPRNRWYFHYQGFSTFGNGDQRLGFADAAFNIDTPGAPPVLAEFSEDQYSIVGRDVQLGVQAFGDLPISYQWLFNGDPMPDETGSALRLTSVATNQSGAYRVEVSNAFGSFTTPEANLTIRVPFGTVGYFYDNNFSPPNIMDGSLIRAGFEPVLIGNIATFDLNSVDLLMLYEEGFGPSYALAARMTDIERWVNRGGKLILHDIILSYQTAAPNPLAPGMAGVPMQSFFGNDIDLVSPSALPLAFGPYGNLLSATLDNPSNISFGGYVASSQIPRNGGAIFSAGPDTSRVVAFDYRLGEGFVFFSTVPIGFLINQVGSPYDEFRNIYIPNLVDYFHQRTPSGAPLIGTHPQNQSVAVGTRVSLSAALSGAAPLTFQWLKNDAPLAGADDPVLVLDAAALDDAGDYRLQISNGLGSITSQAATLAVTALPSEGFRITGLGTNNVVRVEHSSLSGSDRGPIAISTDRVFYSGDTSTVRFNIGDLTGATALGVIYDGLIGNLRTETAYVLGASNVPIAQVGGVVTELLEVDDLTGALTGERIPLSIPIKLAGNTRNIGLFSGYDRMVLHNGFQAYHISLPSGIVTDLGLMGAPAHLFVDSWAYSGVAEFFDGAVHLVTIQSTTDLIRTRVPDGLASSVAQFTHLGAIDSFTVSPSRGRWFFHIQGGSQFGPGTQSLVAADASMEFLTTPEPPVLRNQPQSQSVLLGATVTLRVRASGSTPLRYQWTFNGNDITGATNEVLVVPSVAELNQGTYRVRVSNDLGSALSDAATLTVRRLDQFRILQMLPTNFKNVEHANASGDDHGGIAISASHVYYNGNSGTARFSANDLEGGVNTGFAYDGLFSDLKSERLYAFGDGTAPLVNVFCCNPVTLASIHELNGSTGQPTGQRVNLSIPIVADYETGFSGSSTQGTGIFSGAGIVVVHNGSRVYLIDIVSGQVTDLGAMPVPQHSATETWAYWGVAEFFNGEISLVYAASFNDTIRRTRVPDGTTSVLATFQNLGEIATITVSPRRNRWYYHNEGSSQFGGSDESMGYADAVFEFDRGPVISPLPIRAIPEDGTTGPMAVTIVDSTSAGSNLVFYSSSTNATLILTNGVVVAGSGTNFTITVTPVPNEFGNTFITLFAVNEAGTIGKMEFGISVRSVNDAPTFVKGADLTVLDSAGPQIIPDWATAISPGPPNESNQITTFLVTNDNSALFLAPPGIDATGALSFTPAPAARGTATVSVRLMDNGGTSVGGINTSPAQTFLITVEPSNRPPVALPAAFATAEDQSLNGQVQGMDDDGDGLMFALVDQPVTGVLTFLPDGSFGFSPPPDFNGTLGFTFRVNDGTVNSAPAAVTLTVNPVNDPPAFAKGPDVTVDEDAGSQSVPNWATGLTPGPADESDQILEFIVNTDANNLFTARPAVSASGDLTFAFKDDCHGTVTVTVVLMDNGGMDNGGVDMSAAQTFVLTARSVNDAPSFVKGPDVTVNEDAGTQRITGWATSLSAGPAKEAAQTLEFILTTDADSLFRNPPAINSSGDLTFAFGDDAFGSAAVTVILKDNGGAEFGGVDRAQPQMFQLVARPVNDAPSFAKGPDVTVDEDAGPQVISGWAEAIRAGPANESGQGLRFELTQNNAALFTAEPAVGVDGTFSFTSRTDANGVATVTVRLIDDGGVEQGGIDRSPAQTFSIHVRPVNDAPTASGQSLETREDTALNITLGGSDPDGDTLQFLVVNPPSHGVLSGAGRDLVYTPTANYHGSDAFTFKVNDGRVDSPEARVSLVVRPVNDLPVAVIEVRPLADLGGDGSYPMILSPDGLHARVILDGTGSSDREGDTLQFLWLTAGSSAPFASGAVVTNRFAAGWHEVVLLADDGTDAGMATATFEVITPAQAIEELVLRVHASNLPGYNKRPLLASLKVAAASFDRSSYRSGVNQLGAFQNKVQAQVGKINAPVSAEFIRIAQGIIDAVSEGQSLR